MLAPQLFLKLILLTVVFIAWPCSLWAFDSGTDQAKYYLEKGELQQAELILNEIIRSKPESFDAHFLLGETYARAHRNSEAIAHLEKAIQLNPDSYEALKDLGEIYLDQGKSDKAITFLDRSLALKADQPTTQYSVGMMHMQSGEYRLAVSHLALARSYGLKHSGVLLNLGRACLKLKRIDEAEDALNELRRMTPGDWRTELEVGKAYFDNLLYEDAKPPLARAWDLKDDSYEAGLYLALDNLLLGELPESLKVLLKLKAEGAQSVEVENLLGAVYAKLGQVDKAEELLKKVIEKQPEKPDAYLNLGLIKLEQGDRYNAMELLERAGGLYHGEAKVFYILGTQQACAAYRSRDGVARAPSGNNTTPSSRANFYLRLGEVFEDRFHFTTAAELLAIAQEMDPNDPEILLKLGISCYNLDDISSALEMFRRATSLRPNFAEALYFAGNCYLSLGQGKQAIDAYRQAIKISPQNPTFYYRLGRALFREGQFEEALEVLKAALAFAPDDAGTHSALGRVYLKLDQEDRCVAEFQEAIRLDPALPEPYYYLAQHFARAKKVVEAEEFSKAFQRKTDLARRTPGHSGYIRAKE